MVSFSKPLLVGAAISTVAALGIYYVLSKQQSEESTKAKDVQSTSDVINVPTLPKEQLVSILEAISTQMGQVVLQLAKIEQKVRQESSQNGRAVPEDQLASYLMGQFEEAMKAVESQVYTKYGCTEDETKEATDYYADDEDVLRAVKKLQELYSLVTGQPMTNVEVPEDLTLDKFLVVMEETMEALNVAMEDVCKEVKEQNPPNKEEAINQRYVKKADELSTQIHEKYGLSREVLQAAMMKYQQEPRFLATMGELQKTQAARFSKAGSIFDGEVNMGS